MNKKDHINATLQATKATKTDDLKIGVATSKTLKATQTVKKKTKRPRKVQFAEPLAEQRTYDKALSPIAESETKQIIPTTQPTIKIDQFEPPLSLVAHLDLAATKLNARKVKNDSASEAVDKDMSLKTAKSIKSSGFALGARESKGLAKKQE